MAEYETIFNIMDKKFTYWPTVIRNISFLSLAFIFFYVFRKKSTFLKFFAYSFLIVSILISISPIIHYLDYRNLRNAYIKNEAEVIEGTITNFIPMSKYGGGKETFELARHRIEFFSSSKGFNHTSTFGGPLREGLYIRILFFNNNILKLEIKNNGKK